jgi:hypothetical protein
MKGLARAPRRGPHRGLRRSQPFGVAVVELIGVGELPLHARPILFAIPCNPHDHGGFGFDVS